MNTPHQHSSPALVAHMCTFLFKNRAILLITAGKGTRVVQSLGIAIIMMIIIIVTVIATTIKKDVFTAHTKYTLVRDMEIENHFKYYN